MRPGVGHRGHRPRIHDRHRRPAEIHQRQDQDGQHRHLHLLRLDLLADIFRRAADHQTGDKDRDNDEHQHAVQAGADAANDDFAELDVDERHHAAERGKGVVHGVDRAAGCGRGDDGEQRGGNDAEADFLALHIAAGEAHRGERVVAVRFSPVANGHAGEEQDAHDREDGPTLALVADHAAEHIGERRPDREDREHLHEVRQRRRILEGMRGVGVEEAAAVGAEHLDRDLRGDRADRDGLLGAFQRGCLDIRPERLRHALPDQEQRVDNADRHQDVERATGDIDPEVADRLHRSARKAADQRDREHDAGRRRQEVLVRQPEHLRQIGERAFAAVVLPVGVGDEAHGRVERQVRRHRGLLGRIEWQPILEAHQEIKNKESANVEKQHGDRVGQPMLFVLVVDPASR